MLAATPETTPDVEGGGPRNQQTPSTYRFYRRKVSDPVRIFCCEPCLSEDIDVEALSGGNHRRKDPQ
jgi:hypothetical protein